MVELADSVDAERAGFFFVERAEAGVIDGTGFAQADVTLDDLDDIGLLFHVLGKVGHGAVMRILTREGSANGGKLEKK